MASEPFLATIWSWLKSLVTPMPPRRISTLADARTCAEYALLREYQYRSLT